jgi:hypothetical protein
MGFMFSNCRKFNQKIGNYVLVYRANGLIIVGFNATWGCSAPKDTFRDLSSIGHWNVSKVTNMGFMFYECRRFNQFIAHWDVLKVTNMEFMFSCCHNFNQDN